ncbi:tRNA G37 N-methylase Trm5 [Anaerosolibacter carboniphilus]|uniref:tRNA G37 N-methylase Trm5 n=1 Tax=Anaerosolibacter carboniphilus TaxID=1417629 RepID=A0A841KXE2_9FIRM|nr:class I SAM-dependent methyltransferase [Anaerosolibacter carboniphilus]MBB6216670.1 tRNA G37 N-methylase Trm5 [Anaerosolibacter carboniphilus]
MGSKFLTNATNLSKHIISQVVRVGNSVVDATMGNGYDTLFLRQLVGSNGKVFAFDVQSSAIENTKELLDTHGLLDSVHLIHAGHEFIDLYIHEHITAVMFNLGFLPKGDHRIVTKPHTTIQAIEKSLQLLVPNGIITIAVYYGHEGGQAERDAIFRFVENLDQHKFSVLKLDFMNQKNCPPVLIAIEKR